VRRRGANGGDHVERGDGHGPGNQTFKDNIEGDVAAGGTPGAVLVATLGTDLDFSQLTDPGWHTIKNIEPTGGSEIEIGVYDPETDRYYPFWKIKPGQVWGPELFNDSFQWETYPAYPQGTGTGTGTGGATNRLRLRAKSHACYALVEAFER
jgi:hypothetical protein